MPRENEKKKKEKNKNKPPEFQERLYMWIDPFFSSYQLLFLTEIFIYISLFLELGLFIEWVK